jgi:hypothetical protein
VNIEFLTPLGALIALGVLVPLAAFLAVSRRAARVREALGLPELPVRRRLLPAVAVLALAGLLGLAATQPLVQHTSTRGVRVDAEVFVVIDISRSMLAQRSPRAPSRLERAKAAAARLRAALPGVPVGIASLTNRMLPHLFPSANEDAFQATLERAVQVNHPPPGSGFILTPEQQNLRNATFLASLQGAGTKRFFSPAATHRLLVVLTDGESGRVSAVAVGRSLQRARVETLFLQFWAADERVFTAGVPERQYRPNPAARSILRGLAATTQGTAYDETSLGALTQKARELLGAGRTTVVRDEHGGRLALAPFVAGTAFLPLVLLLWRRSR